CLVPRAHEHTGAAGRRLAAQPQGSLSRPRSRHGPPSARSLSFDAQTLTDQFLWLDFPSSTREEEEDPRRDYTVLPLPKWIPTEQHGLRSHISNLNRWTVFDAD